MRVAEAILEIRSKGWVGAILGSQDPQMGMSFSHTQVPFNLPWNGVCVTGYIEKAWEDRRHCGMNSVLGKVELIFTELTG